MLDQVIIIEHVCMIMIVIEIYQALFYIELEEKSSDLSTVEHFACFFGRKMAFFCVSKTKYFCYFNK